MNKLIIIALLSLVFAWGCDSKEQRDDLQIRVINISNYDYENVVINEETYGYISAGDASSYKSFEMAYSYSYVSLEIEGKNFVLQPIDYVGEVPLSKGKYSYLIDVADFDSNSLTQSIVQDE